MQMLIGVILVEYPDKRNTGHCDYEGHRQVFEIIKPKVDAQWPH